MPDKVIQSCSKLFQVIPQYVCLLKMYKENTRDQQRKYFNIRLCGARVVTENACGMLKMNVMEWLFLYKKQNVDFSTDLTSSWHVLRYITFVLISPILANLDGG